MIKAVVFDMDGVIFDSEALVMETWEAVAEKHGFYNVEAVCRKCLGTNAEATRQIFLEYYGEDFPYDAYKKEMSELFHQSAAGGKLKKKTGVRELMEYLKEKNVRIGLASSTRKEVVCRELEEGGLLEYFDVIVCGDMVNRSKPEPDIYLEACRLLQIAPALACAIEDSYNGIRAASRAGMKAIMVPDLAEPTEEMEELTECILPSLSDVKEFLKKSDWFITPNGDLVVMSIEAYEAMVENAAMDTAISEAEAEYERDGQLHDAREALASLRRKHFG